MHSNLPQRWPASALSIHAASLPPPAIRPEVKRLRSLVEVMDRCLDAARRRRLGLDRGTPMPSQGTRPEGRPGCQPGSSTVNGKLKASRVVPGLSSDSTSPNHRFDEARQTG